MHTKTLYFCTKHAEFHPSTPASLSRKDVGLQCCKLYKLKAAALSKKEASLSKLLKYLKNQLTSSITYISGFNGLLVQAQFHCTIHKKTLPGYPVNILSGKRLTCCRDANKGLDGINNLIFGSELWTSGECPFYLFNLKGFNGYIKMGISINYDNRARSHGKGIYPDEPEYEWWFKDRREARFMEEALKIKFSSRQEAPKALIDEKWAGRNEVFRMEITSMEKEICELKDFLDNCDGGAWEFALQFLNLNDDQARECHSKICNTQPADHRT